MMMKSVQIFTWSTAYLLQLMICNLMAQSSIEKENYERIFSAKDADLKPVNLEQGTDTATAFA